MRLEARFFKRSEDEYRPGRPEPNWLEVHHEQKRGKHVTLQLLQLEYKQAYPDGWGYTQFCAHYHRWLGRQDVVMRLEYAAGERMFVDFAVIRCRSLTQNGRDCRRRFCVSALGASGYLYAKVQAARTWRRGWVPTFGRCIRSGLPPRRCAGLCGAGT